MKAVSRNLPVPNPTLLLFLLTAALAWCALVIQDPVVTGIVAFVALAGIVLPLLVPVLVSSPVFALYVLLIAVVMPRFAIEIAGLNARAEHVAAGLLLLAMPFWLKKRKGPWQWILPDFLLFAYIGANVFSSLFLSIAPSLTMRWAAEQILVILAYFLIRALVTDEGSFRRTFLALTVVGVLEAAYAIICFYSNLFFGTSFGMELEQYGSTPGTYGTQYEANLLGSYTGACCCMMLVMYLRERERKFLVGFGVTLAAMAISLSRGALLGAVFGLLIILLRYRKDFTGPVLKGVSLALLAMAVTVAPAVWGLWSERFSAVELSNPAADYTTRDRLFTIGLASDDILQHPWLGNGTSSFQLHVAGADYGVADVTGWIANTTVRIFHDTGALGLGLVLAFLLALGLQAKRLISRNSHPELEALVLAFAVYCVSFQFTEGSLLAFPWVHLGLIAAGISVYRSRRDPQPLYADSRLQPG
jgi:hypothetical protein